MSLPTAARTGQAAIDTAVARIGGYMPDTGLCLQFVRQNYDVPAVYASAIDAWNAAAERYEGDWNPPPSASVWFWTPSIYRHVAMHVGGGQVVSTYNDQILSFPSLEAVEQAFGGPYMGWAPELNEYSLRPPGGPTPQPPPEEDDMKPMFLRAKTGAIVIVNGNGVQPLTFDHWQVWQNLGYQVTHDDMDEGPFNALIEDLGGWAEP